MSRPAVTYSAPKGHLFRAERSPIPRREVTYAAAPVLGHHAGSLTTTIGPGPRGRRRRRGIAERGRVVERGDHSPHDLTTLVGLEQVPQLVTGRKVERNNGRLCPVDDLGRLVSDIGRCGEAGILLRVAKGRLEHLHPVAKDVKSLEPALDVELGARFEVARVLAERLDYPDEKLVEERRGPRSRPRLPAP